MKGYRMVLFVNGGLFLLFGLLGLVYADLIRGDAAGCQADPTPGAPDCERARDTAETAQRVAPFLFGIGLLLIVLAIILGRRDGPPAA